MATNRRSRGLSREQQERDELRRRARDRASRIVDIEPSSAARTSNTWSTAGAMHPPDLPYGFMEDSVISSKNNNIRKYFFYNGKKIRIPVPYRKYGWKKFVKKLLIGRPMGKGETLKVSAKKIILENSPATIRGAIRMIKTGGSNFKYAIEFQKKVKLNNGSSFGDVQYYDDDITDLPY